MMHLPVIHNEKGFALPMVLGISMIIVVIAFSISDSVRSKTKLAIEIGDKNKAFLAAYSGFNETIFNILSSSYSRYQIKVFQSEKLIKTWNLFNKEISLNDHVSVKLQDTSGLVPYFTGDDLLLRELIDFYAKNSFESGIVMDSLADWTDLDDLAHLNGAESYYYKSRKSTTPRNHYLQLKDEIRLVRGMTPELYGKIEQYLNLNVFGRNYLTMSNDVLAAALKDKEMAERVILLRNSGELTDNLFYEVTGLSWNEYISNYPSTKIRIQLQSQVGMSKDIIEAVIDKKQNDEQPFSILEWKR